MAASKNELREWLDSLPEDSAIAVDDSGLTLVVVGDSDLYFELGGVPLGEAETDGA